MKNHNEKLAKLLKQCSSSNTPSVIKTAENKENYDFHYISAEAGSGKTHWAIERCKYFNRLGINVVIIVPTIQLAESFEDRSNGSIVSIHSDNTETNVISKITDIFLKQAEINADPISIVITEQAFALTNFKFRNDNWILIKDEATEPMTIHSIRCTDSKHLIENWIEFTEITEVKTKLSPMNLTDQCPQTTDDQDGVLQEIYKLKRLLENPSVEIIADTEKLSWEKPELRYSIFAKPDLYSGFKNCYFMSANFEHTFLYQVYKNRGVNWKEHHINTRTPIDSGRIRIHYWSEDNAWSKKYREGNNYATGKSNLESYLSWFQSRESGTDYVYCSNNRDNVDLPGKKMPAVCHGLNDWQRYTKFMSTASYLISNGDEKFYQYYGLTSSDGRALRSVQMLYQQIMRTNLRDSSSLKTIDIYLPTFTEVRDLMRYFPDAIIQDCKKPKAGAKTGITGTLKPNWNGDYHKEPAHEAIPATCIGMGSNTYTKEVSNIPYSDDQDTEGDIICTWDIEEKKFYSHMPELVTQDQVKEKIEVLFLAENEGGNEPYYPPQKAPIIKRNTPKRGRPSNGSALLRGIALINDDISLSGMTKDEIKSAKNSKLRLFVTGQFHNGSSFKKKNCFGNINLLAFDFDNTDLTDKQIKQIFLTCELLIYTTPSHDPNAALRRIRVVVICDRAMTLDEHQKLMDYYKLKFKKLSNQHGLDPSKIKPWSKFYMPHAESEKTHITKEKKPLNVDAILSKIPRKPLITVPDISDFEFKYPISTSPAIHSRKEKCLELIDQMTPGNRSNYAVQVSGMAKYLSEEDKQELYQLVVCKGVDKAALKQFKIYSGLN